MTPAQAERVIAALWTPREAARVRQDPGSLPSLETGSARLTDLESISQVRCGCSKFFWTRGARAFHGAVIYLPRQSRYPVFFAAKVAATIPGRPSADATAFLIITRASPAQPWRIAVQVFDTGYETGAGRFPPPALDSGGYDVSLPPPAAGHVWFLQYVAYLNEIKRTGSQPSSTPFAPGPLTSGNGLEAHPNGFTSGGLRSTYTFHLGQFGGPWTFTSGGTATVCGDVGETIVTKPAQAGHLLLQPKSRRGWGGDLPPGFYRSITSLYEWPICIAQAGGSLSVGGDIDGGYQIRVSGVKVTR